MSTGTAQEKREYVNDQMHRIADRLLGIEEHLEKLASIAPEKGKDLDDIASYLDRGVGNIYSILNRWGDENS